MKKLLFLFLMFYLDTVFAHNVGVTIHNETNTPLNFTFEYLDYGGWTTRPQSVINSKSTVHFGATSSDRDPLLGKPLAGVEGTVKFKMGSGEFYLYFNNPLISGAEGNQYVIYVPPAFDYYYTGGRGTDANVDIYLRNSVVHSARNFLPSTHGLKFKNHFKEFNYDVKMPIFGNMKLGRSTNGLCGGMALAARDFFENNQPVPSTLDAPDNENDPLFQYIKERLLFTFNPTDLSLFFKLMEPLYPDKKDFTSWVPEIGSQGRTFTMAVEEWPIIRDEIDKGHPSPLGLVKVKTVNPGDFGKNHQVLAYKYQQNGSTIKLYIYDPNEPKQDNIYLKFDLHRPNEITTVEYFKDNNKVIGYTIYCFFRMNYDSRRSAVPFFLEEKILTSPVGATLLIPAGNYSMNNPAKITKKITLKATGGSVIIK